MTGSMDKIMSEVRATCHKQSAQEEMSSPGVQFPPPTLFVVSSLTGVIVEACFPLPLTSLVSIPAIIPVGAVLLTAGTALLWWGLATFRSARTAIYPNQPAKQLVHSGPYRFSRNPMYVALTAMSIGVALLADNLWMLSLLPVTLITLYACVIRREEKYLATAFEEEWAEYRRRVRRWL